MKSMIFPTVASLVCLLAFSSCYYYPKGSGDPPRKNAESYRQSGTSQHQAYQDAANENNGYEEQNYQQVDEEPRQSQRQTPSSKPSYPLAERTNNPDQVLSPYSPYNVIDVSGFKSGQLARDPSNQKVFRVP